MSRRPLSLRSLAPVSALALALASTVPVVATPAPAGAAVSAGGFVGVTPKRVLDTREAGQGGCVAADRAVKVTGNSSLPGVGDTTVPDGAGTVALNVTVVSPAAAGFLTVWPTGASRPNASSVNYSAGQIVPNGVIVKVGTGGQISLYALAGCPNVIVDVVGYFDGTTPAAPGGFVGVTPKRLLDTRETGQGPCVTGDRSLKVTGTSPLPGVGDTTVPDSASAVAVNVTVVTPSAPGFLTVYPTGASRPNASNVNYSAGQIVPNNVQVKVGTGGQINLYALAGCPDVIVDVVGYSTGGSPVGEGGFVGITPKRVVDTRNAGNGGCVGPNDGFGTGRAVKVTGTSSLTGIGDTTVPESATAVAANITVVSPGAPGYLTAYPSGASRPTASTLNYVAGQIVPNGTVVKVGAGGQISLYALAGCPNVIVDIVGYYEGPALVPTNLDSWGSNLYGELGDPGVAPYAATPLRVGTATGWSAVSTNGSADLEQSQTCGIRSGALYCWGANDFGQLGVGGFDPQDTPTQVGTATNWQSVSVGGSSVCAINTLTQLFCWGDDTYGQVGDDAAAPDTSVPVQVTDGLAADGFTPVTIASGWASVDVAQTHACGIRTTGSQLYCWGDNSYGQFGDGTYDGQFVPKRVAGASSWALVATGDYHSCARNLTGKLFCIGDNSAGQLGNASDFSPDPPILVNSQVVPAPADSVFDWTAVSAGTFTTCGLRAPSTAWCWGDGYSGSLGNGVATYTTTAQQVGTDADWAAIDVGADNLSAAQVCAVKVAGTLWCWGDGSDYKTGLDTLAPTLSPARVGSATNWSKVSAGYRNSCATRTDGSLWCWGDNTQGQLGVPSSRSSAGLLPVLTDAANASTGAASSCAVATSGSLRCWGSNLTGGLGNGSGVDSLSPVTVGAVTTWSKVSVGGEFDGNGAPAAFACATRTDGSLWCWGNNTSGQLGTGSVLEADTPTRVGSATDWSGIAAGAAHTCGLRGTALYCWGAGTVGQIGDGAALNRTTPTLVPVPSGATGWAAVSAGASSTCAVTNDGRGFCWGANTFGQLGDGTTTGRTTPTQVGSATNWSTVVTGAVSTCGTRADATLWCWGYNATGQVGDGTITQRNAPVQIGTGYARVAVSAFAYDPTEAHACAVRTAGTLWCWGGNSYGQLGDGTTTSHTVPTQAGTGTRWAQVSAGDTHTLAIRS